MNLIQGISDFMTFSYPIIIGVLVASIILKSIFELGLLGRARWILGDFFLILCFPGVVSHEFGHYMFCQLTGTAVHKVKFFTLGDPNAPGAVGYVTHEAVDSFISNFLIIMGPIISNGFMVSLILYFVPNLQESIKYYLIFAFAFCARPSDPDLANILVPFSINPKRAFFELFAIFLAIIPAWFITCWGVYSIYEVNWLLFLGIYFVTLVGLIGGYKVATK